jgi:hypothetical protein
MPPQNPASIRAASPLDPRAQFAQNFWDMVRNSALGYAVESTMPRLADAINMHPTVTPNSPDYQATRNNVINPQFLVPASAANQSPAAATARGALKAAGGMTSGPAMATMAGLAATGGVSGLGGLALNGGLMAHGAYGLSKQAYNGLDLNNARPESYENFGDFLFNAAQLGYGLHGMSKGMDAMAAQQQAQMLAQREGNMVYRAQPLDNAGEGVKDFGSHAQATNDPAQALRYKTDLENMTGQPHEVVRINRNMLPQGSYETMQHPSGAEWTKFNGDVPEHAIDRSTFSQDELVQAAGKNPVGNFVPASPEEYRGALDQNRIAATLTDATPEQLQDSQVFRHEVGGSPTGVYYSITPQGEISGVVNNGPYKGLALRNVMPHAVQNGGSWLNAWDVNGQLPSMYAKHGFTPSKFEPYDPSYGEPSDTLKDAWKATGWQEGQPYPGVQYMNYQQPQRPSFWPQAAPVLQHLWNDQSGELRLGGDTGFDPNTFEHEQEPSNVLAPFGTEPAKRFKSVVPDSVARNLTPGWENILKSPVSQKAMLDYRKQIASPEEVEAAAQLSQKSGFNWYPMSRELGPALADNNVLPEGVNPTHFNGVLAATSPRNPVARNLAEQLDLMNNLKAGQQSVEGDPLADQERFQEWLRQGASYDSRGRMSQINLPYGGRIDVADAKFGNMSRALFNQPLSGLKASSFWGDLNQGNFGTMDTISQKGLGAGEVFPTVDGKSKMGAVFRPAPYMGARSVMSDVANRHGVSVDQIQAPQWVTTKLINDSQALQNAKPADVISHIQNQMATDMPSTDFASIALDALDGKHLSDPRYSASKKDYARVADALRLLHENNEGKLNDFKANLNERLKSLREERASQPLGQPASRPLRRVVGRTQRSIQAIGGADEE